MHILVGGILDEKNDFSTYIFLNEIPYLIFHLERYNLKHT